MGKSQRTKGKRFEQEIARKMRVIFPDARRNLNDIHGGIGVDLANTGRLAIQCKRFKDYAPINKIFEVQAPGQIAILATRADRSETMAVLRLDDLIAILGDVGVVYEK